ncbi:type VI secretion system Vgr family protein [Sorangium sp. So ce1078]|uniref:type VI secretion system Vgr family protein n=1 Tax=Sorangium sp. So ce1078 TaxID=3133329 RepID=UPI003F5D9D94
MHTLQIEGLSGELRVVHFDGQEAISELFRFDITLVSLASDLAIGDAVGKRASLTFRASEDVRHVHGIIAHFELGEGGKKLTTYRAVLVPDVFRLLHRRDSRIFQELSVPDILKKVFDAAGVASGDCQFSLRKSYATREYCVQYRESDWAFACRLMEEEGIAYWFDHDASAHVLVLCDAPSAHPPIEGEATLVFRPPLGALVSGEHVSRFRYAEQVQPGKVTLRDYNFKKPGLSLESSEQGERDDDLEIYDHPGDYDAPGAGQERARVRLEELAARRRTAEGEAVCPRLLAGRTFSLAEHPIDDINQAYLLVRVEHSGHEPAMDAVASEERSPCETRFQAIPADVQFRPPLVTQKPSIKGIQTAIVTGPAGEEIYTDEHGRIKVQFHWDRQGKRDERSSCWIRVSQAWAGGAWGAVVLPRIGHEVVVDFIEGDPDRPLVVGSVYHGANVPPYPLPAEKTKSTLKSNSSSGGDGYNELRFEDRKGSEEIFLHGQKDWNTVVLNDKTQEIGRDEALHVARDRKKRVDNDQREVVGGHKTIDVKKTHTESIGQDERLDVGGDRNVSVKGSHAESVGKDQSVDVGGGQSVSIGKSASISIGKSKTESVGEASDETVGKSKSVSVDETYAITVGKDMTVTVSGSARDEIGENKAVIVGKELTIQVGEAQILIKQSGDIVVQGKQLVVKADGPIQVEGQKLAVKSGGDVSVQASGNVSVKGGKIGMN